MSVRQVIVLHPYTQYELHRPSILNIWLIFGDGVKRPGHLDRWPLSLELVHNVSRGTDNHPANFGVSATFHCCVMGKHTLDWRHDLITLQFFLTLCHPNLFVYMIRYIDFWFGTFYNITARQWNESLYSIPVPSMKFVGLPFGRYGTFYISALIGLETFQPLHGVMSHPCHGLRSCQFSACYALSRLRVRHGRETDRRTDR